MDNKITLKHIFTIENLKSFFQHHKDFFSNYSSEFLQDVKKSILDSIRCRDLNFAKVTFSCPQCLHISFRPVTCKSKFCSSCGKIYSEKWAQKLASQLINKKHRHMIFTLPKEIWNFPLLKRNILVDFANSIKSIFSNWFKKNKITYFGLIVAIHTFGRDSSFYPHFHVILSLGGFDSNKKWKKLEFFEPKFFNTSWRHLVLSTIKKFYPRCNKTKKIISDCYSKKFFVNLKGEPLKTDEKSIRYIGRYLMRLAIAEYRIIKFENNEVTFWYTDIKTKEKITLTLPLFKFMGRLILHINPKGFKAIRRYGFCARNIATSLKDKINTFFKKKIKLKHFLTWRERIIKYYGKDPLTCLFCFQEMILTSFHHQKYGNHYYP